MHNPIKYGIIRRKTKHTLFLFLVYILSLVTDTQSLSEKESVAVGLLSK